MHNAEHICPAADTQAAAVCMLLKERIEIGQSNCDGTCAVRKVTATYSIYGIMNSVALCMPIRQATGVTCSTEHYAHPNGCTCDVAECMWAMTHW